MNGRIYDPKIGRFLQADPIVQAPKNSQSLNRYSYVLNNPLSYTDPTGHSFVKKYWRVIVAAVAVYVTAGLATPWIAGFAWGAGAAAGTLSVAGAAVVGAMAGAVGGAILTGTVKGAFYGALTGAALGAIGASGLNQFGKAVSGGAANGITTELQGGKFGHGFLSAGAGMLIGVKLGGPPSFGKFLGAAIAGGTISALTGGKFANGAISAGLAYVIATSGQSLSRNRSQQAVSGEPNTETTVSAELAKEQSLNVEKAREIVDGLIAEGSVPPPTATGYEIVSVKYDPRIIVSEGGWLFGTNRSTSAFTNSGEITIYAPGADTLKDAIITYGHELGHFNLDWTSHGTMEWYGQSIYDVYLGKPYSGPKP